MSAYPGFLPETAPGMDRLEPDPILASMAVRAR